MMHSDHHHNQFDPGVSPKQSRRHSQLEKSSSIFDSYVPHRFEILAADCLDCLPSCGSREFSFEFVANVENNYLKALALADKNQASMICPWSSYPHGAVALEQSDLEAGKLPHNTIAFQVSAENNGMRMSFTSKPLPLGEVAIPRCCLLSKTRSGAKSADLDPANFLRGLHRISSSHLLECCEEDKSQFNIVERQSNFRLGDLREYMEDQNVEYKYPEETWEFRKFVQKSFNKFLIPLLNGATEKEVELWLGVDKDGRIVGGSATLDGIRASLSHATLDCFPPILKKDITVEVYSLETPPAQDFEVEWFTTVKGAQQRILDLKGRGWQASGNKLYGVVIEKQADLADSTASPATDAVLMNTGFQRYICCVKVRSLFREAYINRHTEFGSMLPFDVWLRARKNISPSFLDGLRSSSSIGFQLGGKPVTVEGIRSHFLDDPMQPLLDDLARNAKKTRFVVFTMHCLQQLVDLIQKDSFREMQSVHFDQSLANWNVAPLLNFGSNMEALAKVKSVFQAFRNVTVAEVLCEGFSYKPLETGIGKFLKKNSFEVIGMKLPEYELVNYKEDAVQFLFPDRPHNDASWAAVEFYVVATTMVREIVDLVLRAVGNQESKTIFHVRANMTYAGLTSTLKKAALLCSERTPMGYSVLFLRDLNGELDFKDLDSYLTSEKIAGRKCVIFKDAHTANKEYDDALDSLFGNQDFCCLVRGAYYEKVGEKTDVTISCVWDADDIKAFRDVLVKLLPSVGVELDHVVQDAKVDGYYPFFVLPLVARCGEYIPIKTRMKEQASLFADAELGAYAECLAFVSATCEESRVQSYLGFSRMIEAEGMNQYHLLKVLDKQGTKTFGHPEAGRVYIWILLKDQLPSKAEHFFPLDKIASFFQKVVQFISNLPKASKTGLFQEICFERGSARFSPFTSFLFAHPLLLDQVYTEKFFEVLTSVIPPYDVHILWSRLAKHLSRYDAALTHAMRGKEAVNPGHHHYRKVLSNLASVVVARYRAKEQLEDYQRAHAYLKELISIESDPVKKTGFEKRLENLTVLHM